MISDSNLVLSTKLSDKNANNSAILAGKETENNFSSNRFEGSVQNVSQQPFNRRAMSDDYFPDDFNDRLLEDNTNPAMIDMGDGGMLDNDDDDDFQIAENGQNMMFLDNLGNPDAMGYNDDEEPEEEDDDVINDDEIVMEEQDDEDEICDASS